MNRIREQYALVRNPFNSHQVSKISLNPDVVDCIVFWSKNPDPMLTRLNELQNYTFYFQYTLNAYGREIEKNLPALKQRIATFQSLSKMIGKSGSSGGMIPSFSMKPIQPAGTAAPSRIWPVSSAAIPENARSALLTCIPQ